jgi:hypothetical protein
MTKAQLLDRSVPVFARTGFAAKLHAFAQLLDTEATAALRLAFNALLAKLDADGTVNGTSFAATYVATAATIVAQFNLLLAALDTDSGVSGTNYASTLTGTADTLGDQFVALCQKLDADGGVADTNYEALHAAAIRGTGHALTLGLGASL